MPAVLLTVGITVISLWENPQMPQTVSLSDKAMHGIMYCLLTITWMLPESRRCPSHWTPYLYVCLGVTFYGGLMEALQRFCTLTRSGEMADLLADFIGACVGVALVALYRYLQNHHHRNA